MKSINKDFKYLGRRRAVFSPAERGLILAMLATFAVGAAGAGLIIYFAF